MTLWMTGEEYERDRDSGYDDYKYDMDPFVCDRSVEELYAYDYAFHDVLDEIERAYYDELGIEPEVYED